MMSMLFLQLLREKEKGDWRKLTVQEKKTLYRASFCLTIAEVKAPTGEWKLCLAGCLIAAGLSIWIAIWTNLYGESYVTCAPRAK